MSQLFLWQPQAIAPSEAAARFRSVLEHQRQLYASAFGNEYTLKTTDHQQVLIGQIGGLTKGLHWTGWAEARDHGVAWGGVCEEFLGSAWSDESIGQLVRSVHGNPAGVARWDGRFCLITWDRAGGETRLTTAATEAPSLWVAEGEHGYAIGSRVRPLLKLVNRTATVALDSATLYLAQGYLPGRGSLYEGAARLSGRQQVIFKTGRPPQAGTYVHLDEYLGESAKADSQGAFSPRKAVESFGARVRSRLARQLDFSEQADILLTSGRDSRLIAAAAAGNSRVRSTRTGGQADSVDAVVAVEVAQRLNLSHATNDCGSQENLLDAVGDSAERFETWMQVHEGLEIIRHATAYRAFFRGAARRSFRRIARR